MFSSFHKIQNKMLLQVETPVPLLARRSQLKTYVKAQATRTPNGRAAADPAERA